METSSFPQLLCAVVPGEAEHLRSFPVLPAYLCYQAGDGPKLYRNVPASIVQGGVLAADDGNLRQIGSASFFCRQAVRECRARGATGFFANWSQEPNEPMRAFTATLGGALAEQGLTLWVTEPYGDCCPTAKVLISSALSGGTLQLRLTDAIAQFGQERVVLAVERMAEDFPLPARNGHSVSLSPEELQSLQARFHPAIYYSGDLCAHYFTYSQENQVHFVLFDTGNSIRKKLLLAKRLGLTSAVLAWEEIKDCAQTIFPPQQPAQQKR